ncbi:MAG: aminotransferase class V-fold PLP-dependent enzyme, partial [Rhodoferax sp.]|nr:aminotransferase class V-fold PLP-dependent enzyme [Rhodoferax sp.]
NPTVRSFEQRLACMEGAQDGVAFSSGMAAIAAIAHAWLSAGKNVVCSRDVFGTTLTVFRQYFGKLGTQVRLVSLVDRDEWRQTIDSNTAFVFLETPSNPTLQVAAISDIAQMAHSFGALVVVDNTLMTPIQQNPLKHGADVVVHSAGKYIDGQGRCVAGVVLGSERLMNDIRAVLRVMGAALSPMDAWLLLKSLETLSLLIAAIACNAMHVAKWLRGEPKVGKVFYTGLPDHPQYDIANAQQSDHGGIVSFEVGVDRECAWHVIDSLKLISIATSIGDTRTMVTHPASTTHGKLTPLDREKAGVSERLIRLSVGLESPLDITKDLRVALAGNQVLPVGLLKLDMAGV